MHGWTLAGTAFLASAVEAVEAMTIVLAVGSVQSWRVAARGAVVALVALAVVVAVFGPVLRYIPIDALKLVVGIFLIMFGLAWLRKAIQRYAGVRALRNENAAYDAQVAELRAVDARNADRVGFVVAFKGVLLEGLEVAIIVITFGAGSPAGVQWSAAGAALAVVLVVALGLALRAPAARVPENTMKFVVGIMLTSFGTFWTGEGLGVAWLDADLSIVFLAVFYLAVSGVLVAVGRARKAVAA